MTTQLFETKITCELYEPKIGKVSYTNGRVGIPQKTTPEEEAEMGWKYTVVSPLSPYAIGWKNWESLCDNSGGKGLAEVFRAEVDFEKKTITVYKKEEA